MKTNSCNKVNTCECDKMLHDIRYEVTTNQTALMSTLADHIRNHCAHVTPEDRQYWNNKANNYQLQEIEGNIKERVIEYIKEIIDEKLESSSITYVSAVGTNGTKLGDIKLGDTILGTIYDSANSQSQSVSANYVDNVPSSASGRYLLGTLTIGNNSPINIYGVDTQSGGTTPNTVSWDYEDSTQGLSNRKKIGTLTINNESKEIYTTDNVGSGEGGVDGDGLQAIYYASTLLSVPTDQDPTKWDAVQQDVYTGPSNSQWSSTPIDLETLGEGAKEWISIRRYTTQDDGTKAWGKFSTPALWAYYSKNGVVDGYTVDIVNENMPVVTDSDGYIYNYDCYARVQVYHNGVKDTNFTMSCGMPTRSDGASVTSLNVEIELEAAGGDRITVHIHSLRNFNGVCMFIPITITLSNGATVDRVITVYGIAAGESATSVSFDCDTAAVRTNYYQTSCYPEKITVWANILSPTKGNYSNVLPQTELANTLGFGFKYAYAKSGNVATEQNVPAGGLTIPVEALNNDAIIFSYYYEDALWKTEYVPFVRDGAPGIGTSAVNYRINVLAGVAIVDKNSNGEEVFTGNVDFQVFKNDGEDTEMKVSPWEASDGELIEVLMDGKSQTPRYNTSKGVWNVMASGTYDGSPYTSIVVRSVTNTVLAAVVIPFVVKGDKGDAGDTTVQGLNGTVMRFTNYTNNASSYVYLDGTTPSSDGITWLDVVQYEGSYYRPSSNGTKSVPPCNNSGETNTGWLLFSPMGDAAFQAFIAKYGFIENLTARELIITDDNNNPVAGMTRGTAVSGDGGETLTTAQRGNVRIWAGSPTVSGVTNLMNCPFYVTDSGYLNAKNASIQGNVIADSLVVVDQNEDVNSGNGTFEGTVEAGGYSTVYDGNLYEGATQDVEVGDVTLRFINGLFIGTNGSSVKTPSAWTGGNVQLVLSYMYEGTNEWTSTEDHTKEIKVVKIDLVNNTAYKIYTDIEYADGISRAVTLSASPNSTYTSTYGWMTGTQKESWANGVKPSIKANSTTSSGFYYYA